MFFKKRLSNVEKQIRQNRNKEDREKKEHQGKLNTDTYTTIELDKIVEENLRKLETISFEELEITSVCLGTRLVYYYSVGKDWNEQVYSLNELKYMKKKFKKLGFETQITNEDIGFQPYIYLRLLWDA
ncbi:hypothetical protein Biyabedamokiny1_00071 [Staphylococcus phage Biyabeda-mokiny_1]|nr:hypothetical protein Biyabedamokiny1_00071 [Staphylococcus phage Biyabeda-mokiny_1]